MARTKFTVHAPRTTKQKPAVRRLTGMHAPMRQVAFSAARIGFMVALAMMLILGLLPAILSVQAATQ
jgi:hypothetical protein